MNSFLEKAGASRTVLLILVVALTLLIDFSGISWRMEQMVTDTVSSLIKPVPAGDIAIVAIDEKSLRKYGRWPWSRRLHARLLDRLRQANSGPVAFDVLFADANGSDPDGDRVFATAIAAHGKVVLAMSSDEDPGDGEVTEVLPYSGFSGVAAAIGHTDMAVDRDGIVRGAYLLAGAGAPRWPDLALAALYLSGKFRVMDIPGETFTSQQPGHRGHWVRSNKVLFPFADGPGGFPVYSFTDVVEGMIDSEKLAGKTLFVGITAAAIRRTFSIPDMASGVMSGVEIHANTFNALEKNLIATNAQGLLRLVGLTLLAVAGGLILLFSRSQCMLCRFLVAVTVTTVLSLLVMLVSGVLLPVVPLWLSLVIVSYLLTRRHIGSLQKSSTRDPLTGLCNRRAFEEHFQNMWRLNSRHKRMLFLMMIDVDHFKRFNDLMGHLKGDAALKEIGRYLQSKARRAGDMACRIGGEEFVVLLDMDKQELRDVEAYAQQIVKGIRDLGIDCHDETRQYRLTVSLGCAGVVPGPGHTRDELFNMADKALYQAKEAGRNRVSCGWPDELLSAGNAG